MNGKRPAGELLIPPAAIADGNAIEMLRVWIAQRGLHCSINIGHWSGREGIAEDLAWGTVLADAVRHIANALYEEQGIKPSETIRRLFKALERELADPTTQHRGEFVRERNTSEE